MRGGMWKCDVSICDTGFNEFLQQLGRGTRDHRSRQGGSRFGKRIIMLISSDTSMTGTLTLHCWKVRRHETRHFRGVLARDIKVPLKVGKEP